MVKVVCTRCNYGRDGEWDFKGTKPVTKCPKCSKHVNIAKAAAMFGQAQAQGTGVELPFKEQALPTSDKIVVEEVSVSVPEQLRTLEDEKKPEEKAKQAAMAKHVEIPYRTIEILCEAPFNLWASFEQDEEFKLKAMDKESLVPLIQNYLNTHMGAWMGQYSNEIAIAIVLGLIVMSRIAIKAKKGTLKLGTPRSASASSTALPESSENKPTWMGEKEGGK